MEGGEQSREQANAYRSQSLRMSELTMSALINMQQQQQQPHRGRTVSSGTTSTIHDNTSPGYGWMLPGWLAEERTVQSGRVYRYYYDSTGRLYRTKQEVLDAWEKVGVVIID